LDLFKLAIIATLLAILTSLGVALFHMTTGKGDSSKMLKALTWRIGLSVALFALLAIAGHQGWISPHGFGR
jgi:choline-glycine betaine transporter